MSFTITENEDKSIHIKYECDVIDWTAVQSAMEMLDEYFEV